MVKETKMDFKKLIRKIPYTEYSEFKLNVFKNLSKRVYKNL